MTVSSRYVVSATVLDASPVSPRASDIKEACAATDAAIVRDTSDNAFFIFGMSRYPDSQRALRRTNGVTSSPRHAPGWVRAARRVRSCGAPPAKAKAPLELGG